MRGIDVLYLYEHAARELDVACAIKSIARDKCGMTIEIMQWPYVGRNAIGRLRPRVIVLPFCYQEVSHNECLMEWPEAIYFNIAWEQLFYPGNRTAKKPTGEFACKHVIHHAWSHDYAGWLREAGVPSEHIFVNGQPAYFLYEPPYNRYFEQRTDLASRYGLDPAKNWVLFAENYGWAFHSEATLESFIARGQTPDQISEMKKFCVRSLREMMEWCSLVAGSEPLELIVRPRPAVPLEKFRAAVEDIISDVPRGMHILQGESVREWIMASDIVVSSHSTSLIEAAVAGKATFIVEPYPIPSSLHLDWHDLVPHVKTLAEFREVCMNRPKATASKTLGDWARRTMMFNDDAINDIAEHLEQLCRGNISHPPIPSKSSIVLRGESSVPVWLLFYYKRFLNRKSSQQPITKVSPEYVKDIVTQEEIERRVQKWSEILATAREST